MPTIALLDTKCATSALTGPHGRGISFNRVPRDCGGSDAAGDTRPCEISSPQTTPPLNSGYWIRSNRHLCANPKPARAITFCLLLRLELHGAVSQGEVLLRASVRGRLVRSACPSLKPLFPWRRPSRYSYNKPSRAARGSPIEPAPAKVAELADAPDLGSGGETHGGSSPPFRTNNLQGFVPARDFSVVPKSVPPERIPRSRTRSPHGCQGREGPLYRVRLGMNVPLCDRD